MGKKKGKDASKDEDGEAHEQNASSAKESGSGSRWSLEEVKQLFRRPFSGNSNRSSEGSNVSWSGMRWSLEDMKNGLFRRSGQNSAEKKKKRKPHLSPEERKQRRLERLQARKEKKSKREKERRSNVNGLFDQLGEILDVKKDEHKAARLSILGAAVERLEEKKGMKGHLMEEDDEDDL